LLFIPGPPPAPTKPQIAAFPIAEALRQLEIEFAPIAEAKGLKLIFVPSSLIVRSDRLMLRRLLQNFVSNAIKYTPKGRVLIGCRRRGNFCAIEVLDTGLGIPVAYQKRVFEEFQRLDRDARAAPGLGLGLSIVERLARVLGHEIALRSKPGAGSAFSVSAPLGAPLKAPSREELAGLSLARPDEPLNGLLVLAIDNEPRVLGGLTALLEKWGCRVIAAAGLAQSLAALKEAGAAPDAIVADYHLDEGDGLAAIAALRAAYGEETPAILATADRGAEIRAKAALAEVAMLNKPLRPAALRALLMRCRTMRMAAE
jgi:CheY-like chemotaxis protein